MRSASHVTTKMVYIAGVIAVLLALRFNPIIAGGYFAHTNSRPSHKCNSAINEHSRCAMSMHARYQDLSTSLVDMSTNDDQL